MHRRAKTYWALVLIGLLTLAAVLFGILVRLNAEYGFVACTATMQFGWVVPVVGGAVLGLVVLLLLGERRYHDDITEMRSTSCSVCGSDVIEGWRLCPHCGQMFAKNR